MYIILYQVEEKSTVHSGMGQWQMHVTAKLSCLQQVKGILSHKVIEDKMGKGTCVYFSF